MENMPSTEYYLIRNSRFQNLSELLAESVREPVLEELEEMAESRPGDESSACVLTKVIPQKDFSYFVSPKLEDCLRFRAEDTGKDYTEIIQWSTPDDCKYHILKGSQTVELEDVLGSLDSEEFEEIMHEIDDLFEPLEDNLTPANVRVLRLNEVHLYEDEGHGEELRDFVRETLAAMSVSEFYVLQWTE